MIFYSAMQGRTVHAAGSYEASVGWDLEKNSTVISHELIVPLSAPRRAALWHGFVAVGVVQPSDGADSWDGAFEAATSAGRVALFVNRNHRSSTDPFKLVHASVRDEQSFAFVLDRMQPVPVALSYVHSASFARASGPLFHLRLQPLSFPVWLTFVQYGSERVRHRFTAADGRLPLGAGLHVDWGAVLQTGVSVERRRTDGATVHVPINEAAGFVRGELAFGAHRGWLRLHGTGERFRSLASYNYPFARGKSGVEGRWQWRLQPFRLISVYGHVLFPTFANIPSAERRPEGQWEMSYSHMPRQNWGWRLGGTAKSEAAANLSYGVSLTVTDPSRRLQSVVSPTWRERTIAWRYNVEWNDGGGRLRFTYDTSFRGGRLEWRVDDAADWGWSVVYKRRRGDVTDKADWLHVELRRNVGSFGQFWVQYMEYDRGRLDVGWQRPPRLSAGVHVLF